MSAARGAISMFAPRQHRSYVQSGPPALLWPSLSLKTGAMFGRLPVVLRWGGVVCLLSAHLTAQTADNVTRDAARNLGLAGVEAYQAGNYDAASDKLEKAYTLMNVPSLGLWSARALAKRQLLVEAATRYFDVVSLQLPEGDATVQQQAQHDAQAELEQLRPQIPRLTIRVSGADAADVALSIDGLQVPASIIGKPRLINPGAHKIDAQLGSAHQSAAVELTLGQAAAVDLKFAPRAPVVRDSKVPSPRGPSTSASSTSPQRTLGWIGLGAGGVGVALGSVMGGLAASQRSSLKKSGCTDTLCPPEKQDDVERLNTFRTVSTVGFIAGGALAATGVVLLLTAPSNEHEVAALVSDRAVLLTGRF